MLRVNHAGEIGANTIYKGQLRILGKDSTIEHMWDQGIHILFYIEKNHLKTFNAVLPQARVRLTGLD
jgi:ubiquinone biosynthesis monooxygenase Coq7